MPGVRTQNQIRIQKFGAINHEESCCGNLDKDILHLGSSYTDLAPVLLQDPVREIRNTLLKTSSDRNLAQEVPQDPDAKIPTDTSWTRDPHTKILHKWSNRSLEQNSRRKDFGQEICIQRSCTSGHKRSRCRGCDIAPAQEVLTQHLAQKHESSSHARFAQVAPEAPETQVLTQIPCTRDPHTKILHKWP